MGSLFLLIGGLSLFPQFLDKHAHMLRLGSRKRIFAAEVKVIPQPLPVIRVTRDRDRPLLKNG